MLENKIKVTNNILLTALNKTWDLISFEMGVGRDVENAVVHIKNTEH